MRAAMYDARVSGTGGVMASAGYWSCQLRQMSVGQSRTFGHETTSQNDRDRALLLGYRWCPRPMPSFSAFCLKEPSDRFINLVSFDTGVLAFECAFNNLTSDAVYSVLLIFFFVAF